MLMSNREKNSMLLTVFLMAILPVVAAGSEPTEETDQLINQCAMCHNKDGNSTINSIPSFAGIDPDYFKYAMEEYKNGNRKSDIMKRFADQTTPEEIDRLASYYARQTYQPAKQEFNKELAEKGKAIHDKYCIKCHENNGYPNQYSYGILGGQWTPYLQLTIKEYLDGSRKTNEMMAIKLNRVKNEIGEQGFEQLLQFYAGAKK